MHAKLMGGGGAWLRCPWAVAGPGRTTSRRAERSSRRGRLAGGPPPTGTQSSPAPQPGPTAPGTPAAPQATQQQAPRQRSQAYKNRHPNRMSVCGGARGIRTPDLLIANETRYQLRHSPKDSHSLAPSQSATQADHRRVRHDTEWELKMATCACTPTIPKAHICDRAAGPRHRGAASQRFANYCARRASRTASRSRATA